MSSKVVGVALSAVIASGVLLGSQPALAADPVANDPRQQVDQAFKALLAAPGNLDVGYSYARALINAGNYEGGISALERMLMNPNAAPSIRLELAVLYYRLGSYEMAATYAKAASEDPALDPGLRATAANLYEQATNRTKTHQFTMNLTFGLRAQSNPTAASSSSDLMAGGAIVQRPAGAGSETEADMLVMGNLEHVWDFGAQNNTALVTQARGYGSRFFDGAKYNTRAGKTDPQDLFFGEVTSGIRFSPSAASPAFTLKPYVLLGDALLSGHQYFLNYGGGLEGAFRNENGDWAFTGGYELRGSSYAKRNDVSEAKKQGGFDHILSAGVSHEFLPAQILALNAGLRDRNTDRDYFDFTSGDLRLTYIAGYTNPFGWDQQLWSSSFYVGGTYRKYDGADAAVDPDVTRKDAEWRIGVNSTIPFSDNWSILLQAEYSQNDSNIRNYDYNNALGLVGVMWRY
ncbi:hypothetical protein ACFSM5_01450 [Lacibacterium aquatile]|uniref:Tetratricopeptide repeat protein n=1 Tax=Lacibacterium aquatile TaxID=1168082 RepID=A0ABW5DM45_9PROT